MLISFSIHLLFSTMRSLIAGDVSEGESFSYASFLRVRLKALRKGSWRRLNGFEKALFKASMQLARMRGKIVNPLLVRTVETIFSKLVQTPIAVITRLGRKQAFRLLQLYEKNGLLKQAPSVRSWLKDPEYVLWLGVKQLALKSVGY
jgi:hypothetical protein